MNTVYDKVIQNKKAFSIVEVLIVIVVFGLIGLLAWSVFQAKTTVVKPDALLYGYFDGLSAKVNRFSLSDERKELLFEQSMSEPDVQSGLDTVLKTQISHDKQMVAYRFGNRGKVRVIKTDGSAVHEVKRGNVSSFAWRRISRNLY